MSTPEWLEATATRLGLETPLTRDEARNLLLATGSEEVARVLIDQWTVGGSGTYVGSPSIDQLVVAWRLVTRPDERAMRAINAALRDSATPTEAGISDEKLAELKRIYAKYRSLPPEAIPLLLSEVERLRKLTREQGH